MNFKAILKNITIKNSDTDIYVTVAFEADVKGLDLNELCELRHKPLELKVVEGEED